MSSKSFRLPSVTTHIVTDTLVFIAVSGSPCLHLVILGVGGVGFRDSFYVHLVTLVHLITMPQSHPLPMVISNPHNHSQKQEGSFFKPIVYMEKLNLGKSKKLKQILKNRKGQKHDLNSGLSDSQTHVLSTTRISPLFIWRRTTPHSSIY